MTRSIRKQLIIWLSILLGLVCVVQIFNGYYEAVDLSNEVYDEQLLNSADSVAARLEPDQGGFKSTLPPDSLEIFTHNNVDNFYFEVFDSNGSRLAGNTHLLRSQLDLQGPNKSFRTLTLAKETARLVQVRCSVPEVELKSVIVISAETQHSRERLISRVISGSVFAQLMLALVSTILVWLAINRMFAPLSKLRESILGQSIDDLKPVSAEEIPSEVKPLVEAVNGLLARSRDELASRNRFVANAAHQLRTPIAGLKAYSSMSNGLKTVDEYQEVMSKMDLGIDRVTRLVNQLLSLARVEQSIRTPIDLNAVVSKAVIELLDVAMERNTDLEVAELLEGGTVDGDPTGLRHLAFNLLENAIFYSGKNGKVKVSVYLKNGSVALSVEDNGPGISEAEREHIYERFYRIAGSTGNGSGLGMSIVKEVVLSHNATVSIDNPESGTGTIVTVIFPKTSFATTGERK